MPGRTAFHNDMPIKGLLDRIDALHESAEAAAHAQAIRVEASQAAAETPWRSPDDLLQPQQPAQDRLTEVPDPIHVVTDPIPPAEASPADPVSPFTPTAQVDNPTVQSSANWDTHAWSDDAWQNMEQQVELVDPSQLTAPPPAARSRTFMLVLGLAIAVGISLPATLLAVFYFRSAAPELMATPPAKVAAKETAAPVKQPVTPAVLQPTAKSAKPTLVVQPLPLRADKAPESATVAAQVPTEPRVTVQPSSAPLQTAIAPLTASRKPAPKKPAGIMRAGALGGTLAPLAPKGAQGASPAANVSLIVLRELKVVAGDSVSLPARLDPPPRIPNAGRILIQGLPEGFTVSQAKKGDDGTWALDPRALPSAKIVTPKTASGRITLSIALAAGSSNEALARAESTITVLAAPDAKRLNETEAATLIRRGDALLTTGDIDAARLLYRLAAEGSSGQGAFKLAETYDPNVVRNDASSGWSANLERARAWYMRAAVLGTESAAKRLRTLPSP